jgi:hypothetical protein
MKKTLMQLSYYDAVTKGLTILELPINIILKN